MDNKGIFAANLLYLMRINGKSRKDVCSDLGFSYYTFSDWVHGKKYPRMDKVERLANYFGVLKSDLIEDRNVKALFNPKDKAKQMVPVISLKQIAKEYGIKPDIIKIYEQIYKLQLKPSELKELYNFAKYLLSKRNK